MMEEKGGSYVEKFHERGIDFLARVHVMP